MKLLIPLLIAIIVIGGTFIGLGYAGVVNIPGITPEKKAKQANAADVAQQGADEANQQNKATLQTTANPAAPAEQEPPAVEPPSAPSPEPEVIQQPDGTERVAKLWASMDAQKVAALVQAWKDGDVVMILAKMDDEKLAEVLAALPPEKALEISRGIKAMDRGGK